MPIDVSGARVSLPTFGRGAWTAGVPSLPTVGFRASFACALLLMPLLVGEAVHSRRRMKE